MNNINRKKPTTDLDYLSAYIWGLRQKCNYKHIAFGITPETIDKIDINDPEALQSIMDGQLYKYYQRMVVQMLAKKDPKRAREMRDAKLLASAASLEVISISRGEIEECEERLGLISDEAYENKKKMKFATISSIALYVLSFPLMNALTCMLFPTAFAYNTHIERKNLQKRQPYRLRRQAARRALYLNKYHPFLAAEYLESL